MRRSGVIPVAILLLLGLARPLRAQNGPIQMSIVGTGSRAFPIAVSQLKNLSGDDRHQMSAAFVNTLVRDLDLSGFFKVLDPHAYIEDPQNSGYDLGQFNFADWSSINAYFLVKGAVSENGSDVTLEALLFDVTQQQRMMGKRFTGSRDEVARMARRFADAVLQATTGQRGPFDSRLAFVSTRGGRFKEVYTSTADGQELFQVTNNPTINLFPSFDRSTRRLLYLSYKGGVPALYLADLGTQRESRIETGLGRPVGGALMPDGASLVAAIERNGRTNLYLLDSSGREIKPLTDNRAINVDPSPSADGKRIAFTSDRSGSPQAYVMEVERGDASARRVTYRGEYNAAPSYSPKGDKIAYQSLVSRHFEIYTVGLSGGAPTRLTEGQSPCWSPDGRYLAFSSARSGNFRLYLIQVSSGKIVQLMEDQGNDTSPTWSWWLGD